MRKMTHTDFDHMVSFFDQMVQTSWLSGVHTQILDHAQAIEDGKVLDIGCGTGKLLHRLMIKFKTGVGVDLSPEMIREATRQASEIELSEQLHFEQGDAYQLPLRRTNLMPLFQRVSCFCCLSQLKGSQKWLESLKVMVKL